MIIDAHCDTITAIFEQKKELRENDLHIDLKKLQTPSVQFFAVFLNKEREKDLLNKSLKIIDFFHNEIKKNNDLIAFAKSYDDILKNTEKNISSGVLAIEGGEILEGKIDSLTKLYNQGVRAMTLTWNYDNQLASGVKGCDTRGLTTFGREVVSYMNEKGIIIDVSHLNDKSFFDVIKISRKPIIASHSNARAIHPSKRNLTDEQLKLIANNGGVIGINMYPPFLCYEKATINDVMNHVKHIINIGGGECVGLGSDFDGVDSLPSNVNDVRDLVFVINKIEKEFGIDIAEKISHKNYLRLTKEVWN